jgi:predicted TIM-barrel enzyme
MHYCCHREALHNGYGCKFFFLKGKDTLARSCINLIIFIVSMEVEMISMAHRMGFLTTPYAFNPDEAAAMAKAGAHIVVAHMGLTTAGSIGAMTAATLDDSVLRVQAIADAAFGVNSDIIVLCHGGTCIFNPLKDSSNMFLILE